MRGMSLPIEMIVVIAVAVLVLVVIAVFFVGGAGGQIGTIEDRNALSNGCIDLVLRPNGCATGPPEPEDIKISGYNTTCGGKTGGTLDIACCKIGYTNAEDCKVSGCRCAPQ